MPDALSDAKAALAHANKSFPSPSASPAPKSSAVTPAAKTPNLGDELAAKKTMVDKAMQALPKMHKGGPVPADGAYNLKAGEHVLTANEAAKAKTHALMASGMASLAKPGPKRGTASMTIEAMPPKPKTFADKNLDTKYVPQDIPAKGGSISAQPNAKPAMGSASKGLTKA